MTARKKPRKNSSTTLGPGQGPQGKSVEKATACLTTTNLKKRSSEPTLAQKRRHGEGHASKINTRVFSPSRPKPPSKRAPLSSNRRPNLTAQQTVQNEVGGCNVRASVNVKSKRTRSVSPPALDKVADSASRDLKRVKRSSRSASPETHQSTSHIYVD